MAEIEISKVGVALGILPPWEVQKAAFNGNTIELDVALKAQKKGVFGRISRKKTTETEKELKNGRWQHIKVGLLTTHVNVSFPKEMLNRADNPEFMGDLDFPYSTALVRKANALSGKGFSDDLCKELVGVSAKEIEHAAKRSSEQALPGQSSDVWLDLLEKADISAITERSELRFLHRNLYVEYINSNRAQDVKLVGASKLHNFFQKKYSKLTPELEALGLIESSGKIEGNEGIQNNAKAKLKLQIPGAADSFWHKFLASGLNDFIIIGPSVAFSMFLGDLSREYKKAMESGLSADRNNVIVTMLRFLKNNRHKLHNEMLAIAIEYKLVTDSAGVLSIIKAYAKTDYGKLAWDLIFKEEKIRSVERSFVSKFKVLQEEYKDTSGIGKAQIIDNMISYLAANSSSLASEIGQVAQINIQNKKGK